MSKIQVDMGLTAFEGINAGLHIVWKDHANANGKRPNEVTCILTQTYKNTQTQFEIVLTKDSVAWKDPANAPVGAILAQGAGGDWTLSLKSLPETNGNAPCSYTLIQKPLEGEYTTLQSGTAAINTCQGYLPKDDKSARLTTRNSRLYDAAGNMTVLKGVVTLNAGIYGLDDTTSVKALQKLARVGCNALRLTAQLIGYPGQGSGYVYYNNGSSHTGAYNDENATRTSEEDKQKMLRCIDSVIQNASEVGLYTVIDWGILGSNPYQYLDEASEFFGTLAETYRDNPYVLFEICNEPHSDTPWGGDAGIRAYAEAVIGVIRKKGSDAVVIVGPRGASTFLSTDTGDDPVHDPISESLRHNVAYTFHCYPYNYNYHTDANPWHYAWRLRAAYEAGMTVISTETSPMNAIFAPSKRDALGHDMPQMKKYLRLFYEYDVSFFYFRYASSPDGYNEWMMFRPGLILTDYEWTRDDLTVCGQWYYDLITGDGVFNHDVDYTAIRKKDWIPQFDNTHAAFGLGNTFPGFADGAIRDGAAYFFKIGESDSLYDVQYVGYCERILSRIRAVANGTERQIGGEAFTEADLPRTRTQPMELTYRFEDRDCKVRVSYGQHPADRGFGILLEAE